jgi:hypothetical protein
MSVAQERSVPEFDRVDLRGVGTAVVRQGPVTSVVVDAPERVADKVRTEVRDGELRIALRWWAMLFAWASVDEIEVRVTAPGIKALTLSGAGKILAPEPIEAEDLDLKLSGAGSLDLKVRSRTVSVRLSGAGSIAAAGSADRLETSLTGAGRFDGSQLEVKEARVRTTGAGETLVFAVDSLDVTLTGAGAVRYKGNPKLTSRISGIGSLTALG